MDLHEMIRYDIYKKKNAIDEILIKSCNEDIIVKKSDLS